MQTNFIETPPQKETPPQFGTGGNDENYTPPWGVMPILEYIPKGARVWCPFDLPCSEYVKQISKTHEVIFGHIATGQDFYKYTPHFHAWDVCITNPPFTNKAKIFERLLKTGKPFAILMTFAWFRDVTPYKIFSKYNTVPEIMFLYDRLQFLISDDINTMPLSDIFINICKGELEQKLNIRKRPKKLDKHGKLKDDRPSFASWYICHDFLPNGTAMSNVTELKKLYEGQGRLF